MKTTQKQRAMLRRDIAPNVAWMTSLLDDLDEALADAEAWKAMLLRVCDAYSEAMASHQDDGYIDADVQAGKVEDEARAMLAQAARREELEPKP